MRITYIDGTEETINAAEVEIGDFFVTFRDEDDGEIAEVSNDQIRKITY